MIEAIKSWLMSQLSSPPPTRNILSGERTDLLRKKVWMTQDKRLVKVKDMEDTHLVNTLRMLKRTAEATIEIEGYKMACGPQPHGDGAQMAFDSEMDHLAHTDWVEMYDRKALNVLLKEARRRKLDWENSLWF